MEKKRKSMIRGKQMGNFRGVLGEYIAWIRKLCGVIKGVNKVIDEMII